MTKPPDTSSPGPRDDADRRDGQQPGGHQEETSPRGRPDHYAAGADGTQQVTATPEPMDTSQDPLPPSPLAKDRMQPPIEPET